MIITSPLFRTLEPQPYEASRLIPRSAYFPLIDRRQRKGYRRCFRISAKRFRISKVDAAQDESINQLFEIDRSRRLLFPDAPGACPLSP